MSSAARLPVRVEPEGELWFAVQTRFRFEKKVAAELTNKGMRVFVPLRKESRCWGDRTKEVSVPLFPGHLFVWSDRSVMARIVVLQTPGVMGFASMAGTAATISQKQIDDLKLLLTENISVSAHPFAKTGQLLRIRGGPLDGIEGLQLQGEKNKLLISIDAIQHSLAIDIGTHELEVI
jgi:transcription termination/antitermination protein NusG